VTSPAVVIVDGVSHSYGSRVALRDVSFRIAPGEWFALLGPNGGGKTTLFRILSTLHRPLSGRAEILGFDTRRSVRDLRRRLGVVFQAPALDVRLTVTENLRCQGKLHGLSGRSLGARIDSLLQDFGLADRRNDLVLELSGGLRRRVELARAILHEPEVLLLDEPSTGLDPLARREFWNQLERLRRERNVTILLTTHLMDEAQLADRLAVIDAGRLVAIDTPEALRSTVGGDVVTIKGRDVEELARLVEERFGGDVRLLDGHLHTARDRGHEFVTRLVEAFPGRLDSVTVSRPTLEDAFVQITGHTFI
jgi:ABC-2 type transport system ATP-binding protein